MATKQIKAAVQLIHSLVTDPGQNKEDDGRLLTAFLASNDQVAFATIVRRHGPMVFGICHRFLNDFHAAEDAFQATFILLAQKAACIRKKESLASWLHGVGLRMAHETKRAAMRRRRNERQSGQMIKLTDPAMKAAWQEVQTILDEEIHALPNQYREPFIRCWLEQFSSSEIANQLGMKEATVRKRLARAREKLREQLSKRGVSLSAVLACLAVSETGAPIVLASSLIDSVTNTAVHAAEGHSLATVIPQHVFSLVQGANKVMFLTKMKMAAFLFVALATVGGVFGINAFQTASAISPLAENPNADESPTLVSGHGDSILLPANTSAKLGIRVGEVKQRTAAKQRVLELAGSTALMPNKIARITGGFAPFEVIEIGKFEAAEKEARQLRVGDKVTKGQVLATIASAEIGKKKNELFDAAVQLKLDQIILERAGQAAGAVTGVFLLNAKRNALTDLIAVTRAQDNLKTWGIPDDEIETVRKQAQEVAENPKLDTEEQRKTRLKEWNKTALRSPIDGIIVECNIHTGEVVADSKTNLFQIANLDQLLVMANIGADDLRALESLKATERRWSIKATGTVAPIEGVIDEFSHLEDPKEYAAVVKGHVDNKDHRVRAGQYITACITLPLPTNEMVLSAAALVEEKGQTFVFVQTDPKKPVYEQRRIVIVRRGLDVVHVSTKLTPEQEKQGFQTIKVGERIVTTGAIELKAILDDLKGR